MNLSHAHSARDSATVSLQETWAEHTTDMHEVDVTCPRSLALLQQAYNEVYKDHFNEKNGAETLEKWMTRQQDDTSDSRYIIHIAGENLLTDTGPRKILGIGVGIYYKDSATALLAYNAVSPDARNKGIGRKLVDARMASFVKEAAKGPTPLRGVFVECNKPKMIAEGDTFGPEKRIKLYQSWGARVVGMNYVCPHETEVNRKTDSFMLMAFPNPVTGVYPRVSDVAAYLEAVFIDYSIPNPRRDADYKNMIAELRRNAAGDDIAVIDAPVQSRAQKYRLSA